MPTDAPFDPCKQWLGIDAVHVGNARLVLGVSPQEADPLVVLRAAEARLNLLRAISPGPFEMARTGLIKRVEEAREKLLAEIAASPLRPRTDAAAAFAMPVPPSQRVADGPPVPATRSGVVPSVPPAVPGAVPPVPPTVPGGGFHGDGGGVEAISIRTTVYRKKTPVAGLVIALLTLSAMAGGLFYYASSGKAKAKKSGERQTARAEPAAAQISPGPAKDRMSKSAERPARKPAQMEEEKPADPTDDRAVSTSKPPSARRERDRRPPPEPESGPQPDEARLVEEAAMPAVTPPQPMRPAAPQKPSDADGMAGDDAPAEAMAEDDGQLDAAFAEVLEAIRRQEYDTVTRLLAAASKRAGGRRSGSAVSKRLDSWQQLATYAKGFMDYREQALAAVKPGDEYDVKNQKVGVVEVDDEKFIYRSAGGNKTVPRDKIPAGIVMAIVMQWFDSNPANDLYIGAYHLAKPEPDPTRAREYWERAEAAGADASGLMPLLDDPVFAKAE